MFKLLIDYPVIDQERQILKHYAEGRDNRDLGQFDLQAVMNGEDVLAIQRAIVQVIVEPSIINYISDVIVKTRAWHTISVGASPRAGVHILLAARAMAACRGRDFVVPDDVKELAPWVLRQACRRTT